MGNLEMTMQSPDLGVLDDGSEAVVGENRGSLIRERPDVGVFKGKRLPEAPVEESICAKRARLEDGKLEDPIFSPKYADIFTCQRCGNAENAKMLVKLGAVKCSLCRLIMWFPPRYHVYQDETTGQTRSNRFVNVYPDGYAGEIGVLKERCRRVTRALSFPYGEGDLMDFEVTIKPKLGLYKRARVVFSFDVPPMYPIEPPVVRCKTKIFHPLIDLEGNVGIGILGNSWSQDKHRIGTVVHLLENILTIKKGNVMWGPVVTLNHEAAAMLKAKRKLFSRNVKEALGGGFVGETYFPRCLIDK